MKRQVAQFRIVAFALALLPCVVLASGSSISEALMPAELLAPNAVIEVDWQIDDLSKPGTPFEKAVAPKLAKIGVLRTISVTYEIPDSEGAMYSFEAHQFGGPVTLESAIRQLKPGLLELGEVQRSQIDGFPSIEIELARSGIKLVSFLKGQMVVAVVVPNPAATDITAFVEKYLRWHEGKQAESRQ